MHRLQRSQSSPRAADALRPAAFSRRLAAPANPAVPCARCASAARDPCTRLTCLTACPCPPPAISVASRAASARSTRRAICHLDAVRVCALRPCVSRAPSARPPLATPHATPHSPNGVPLHHHRRSQLPPALRRLPLTPRYRPRRRDAFAHRPCGFFRACALRASAVRNSRSQLSTA